MSSHVWTGADPTEVTDPSTVEIGTVVAALAGVTVEGLRIYSPAGSTTLPGREGHVWTPAGVLLATVPLPTDLPVGWSEHLLTAPLTLFGGQFAVVSYTSAGHYGTVPGAFTASPVVSADGALAFPQTDAVRHGNGVFETSAAAFPASTFNATFYGVDVAYTPSDVQGPPVLVPGTWTRTLVDGLATYLAGQAVAVYRPTGAYQPTETAITIAGPPQAPDRVVALTYYPVTDDAALSDVVAGVQIRCRGVVNDPNDAGDLADAVYDALHGQVGLVFGGIPTSQIRRQSSASLGQDALGRYERADNYYIEAVRSSATRTD